MVEALVGRVEPGGEPIARCTRRGRCSDRRWRIGRSSRSRTAPESAGCAASHPPVLDRPRSPSGRDRSVRRSPGACCRRTRTAASPDPRSPMRCSNRRTSAGAVVLGPTATDRDLELVSAGGQVEQPPNRCRHRRRRAGSPGTPGPSRPHSRARSATTRRSSPACSPAHAPELRRPARRSPRSASIQRCTTEPST